MIREKAQLKRFTKILGTESINFADNRIIMTEVQILLFGRVKNIVGKGENAGYYNVFRRGSFSRSFKVGIVW